MTLDGNLLPSIVGVLMVLLIVIVFGLLILFEDERMRSERDRMRAAHEASEAYRRVK